MREAREDIHLQQYISKDVAEWERRKKPKDRLYRGSQLKDAQAWAMRNMPSSNEVTFLRASAVRRMRYFVSITATILLFVLLIGYIATPSIIAIVQGTAAVLNSNVIVCLTGSRYVADPNPAPDHGVLEPVYLQTTFNLRNLGSAQAVTFIHITLYGSHVGTDQIIPTNVDYAPPKPIAIAGNGEFPNIMIDLLVDQRAEVKSFESAESQVTWIGGHSQLLSHIFDGTQWQNDSACSS